MQVAGPEATRQRLDHGQLALLAVALLHAVSPLVLVGVHHWYGWDETVYISQHSVHAPAGYFSAPRAQGVPLLVSPIASLTGSVAAMRCYLAALSGIALYVSFRPWQQLRGGWEVPLAALMFSSLWVTIDYGYQAMPNQYVAYCALAATGYMLRAIHSPDRIRYVVYIGIAVALTTLFRPSDATFLVVPLAVVALCGGTRPAHRVFLLTAVAVGLAAGWEEWVIEAFVRFGGPVNRFHIASVENTAGLHFTLPAQFQALSGPLLCRGSCSASSPLHEQLWWFALPPLTVLTWVTCRSRAERLRYGAATGAAVTVAAPYIFVIAYAAPRFLLPCYALLSLPCARGLLSLPQLLRPAFRPAAIAGVAMTLVTNAALQINVLRTKSCHRWMSRRIKT